jgi:acyl carrier protein
MATIDRIRALLGEVLQLGGRAETLDASTPLLGGLPEFDSMAVATVIAGIEEKFDLYVEDDELSAEVFRSVGTLTEFVDAKLAE